MTNAITISPVSEYADKFNDADKRIITAMSCETIANRARGEIYQFVIALHGEVMTILQHHGSTDDPETVRTQLKELYTLCTDCLQCDWKNLTLEEIKLYAQWGSRGHFGSDNLYFSITNLCGWIRHGLTRKSEIQMKLNKLSKPAEPLPMKMTPDDKILFIKNLHKRWANKEEYIIGWSRAYDYATELKILPALTAEQIKTIRDQAIAEHKKDLEELMTGTTTRHLAKAERQKINDLGEKDKLPDSIRAIARKLSIIHLFNSGWNG